MFAAIFNSDRRPVELRSHFFDAAAFDVQILGRFHHVALLRSKNAVVGADSDLGGIVDLEHRYWIVGRIRLDARRDLRARLSERFGKADSDLSDAMLCLQAYARWGDAFLDHLAGDFCFALWDEQKARLICVRDQFGVRSLFHASPGKSHFISDRLDWVASSPGVGRDLDECWIADFLVADLCTEFERTVYRQVQRLAPAHVLTVSEDCTAIRRYWRLTIDEPLGRRDQHFYGERFRELVGHAIADRMTCGKVGISMSGGLDSTTLAACAVDITGDPSRVVAECDYFETLIPDEEKHFSALAARHLGIELELRPFDDLVYDPGWPTRQFSYPEPSMVIVTAHTDRLIAGEMEKRAGVWFYGEGPDNALRLDRDAYFSWLFRRGNWCGLANALFQYVRVKGLNGWAATLRRHTRPEDVSDQHLVVPPWLDRGLVEKVRPSERMASLGKESSHPWHPDAMTSVGSPAWQRVLGDLELDELAAGFVWRHPFLDLRVLEFMLSVPPVPWAWEKQLLREAMRGRLPRQVLTRKKTPLARSPLAHIVGEVGLPSLALGSRLAPYVDLARLRSADLPGSNFRNLIAVYALDHWLGMHHI